MDVIGDPEIRLGRRTPLKHWTFGRNVFGLAGVPLMHRRSPAMPAATQPQVDTDSLELGIATDKVCYVIVKARQFDVKEGNADPDSGSDAIDDGFTDVLEDKPDDPVYRELVGFINVLDLEGQLNLVALAWLGRGTYDRSEWNEAPAT